MKLGLRAVLIRMNHNNMFLQVVSFAWLCLVPQFFLSTGCTFTSISTRQHQVVFHYRDEYHSERDLPLCDESSVCNVLHKRYWLPPVANRLCRCTNNEECQWRWSDVPNNRTMMLNNRSQLKFCSPVQSKPSCTTRKSGLVIKTIREPNSKHTYEVTANCFCPPRHRWKYFKTTKHIISMNGRSTVREEYKCVPLKRCNSREFCGNVRADYSSIYYVCSCPVGHFCMYNIKIAHVIEELFYKGPGYKAYCEPYDPSVDYGDY